MTFSLIKIMEKVVNIIILSKMENEESIRDMGEIHCGSFFLYYVPIVYYIQNSQPSGN